MRQKKEAREIENRNSKFANTVGLTGLEPVLTCTLPLESQIHSSSVVPQE
jgi:hypothetical protein